MRNVGDLVPEVTFKLRTGGEWQTKTSRDFFKGRRVIVFALPGAFTPTCSSTHLPGYMTLSKSLKTMGVDEIFCLSVNDAFVMNAWAKDQGVDEGTPSDALVLLHHRQHLLQHGVAARPKRLSGARAAHDRHLFEVPQTFFKLAIRPAERAEGGV